MVHTVIGQEIQGYKGITLRGITLSYVPLFSPEVEARTEEALQTLIETYGKSNHRKKFDVIVKAFELARIAHVDQVRQSGEPYIRHPLAVAQIVCQEMGLGSTSIACALMHDVAEDTKFTLEDITELFGEKIAEIVDGLTKVSGILKNNDESNEVRDSDGKIVTTQSASLRKTLGAMSNDPRVMLIKIADRLHNMRTLGAKSSSSQQKIAEETLRIYAPLAHRLGLNSIKTELESWCFKFQKPEDYEAIEQQIQCSTPNRDELLKQFTQQIEQELYDLGIVCKIESRVKSHYSIWRKMQAQQIGFDEVYDYFAVRIIFPSTGNNLEDISTCWKIHSFINTKYYCNPMRTRDWLNHPKSNGYQALHITVMGPEGRWVEVQIRSSKMDDIAEFGLSAHWKYKGEFEEDKLFEGFFKSIREILDNPSPDGMDLLDNLNANLYSDEIQVFTPKGANISLPIGAVVLDFAYRIHSKLGDHCLAAKVNHKVVPLTTVLKSGDQVEIIHLNEVQVKEDWLDIAKTTSAKIRIRKTLNHINKQYAEEGEALLRQHFVDAGKELTTRHLDRFIQHYGYKRHSDLFAAIGRGVVDCTTVPTSLKESQLSEDDSYDYSTPIDHKQVYTLEKRGTKLNYQPSACCQPIHGDNVLGVNESGRVVVHQHDCSKLCRIKVTHGDTLLSTQWGKHLDYLFEAIIHLEGYDNVGVLLNIAQLFQSKSINIKQINIDCSEEMFSGDITIAVATAQEVEELCVMLQKEQAISRAYRLYPYER